MKIIILIVLSLAMCSFIFAQSPLAELDKAREIILLESTKDDVRMILADYNLDLTDDSQYYHWFSNKNTHIMIRYSKGGCSDNSQEWNVPEWKVTEITVSPKASIKDIGIDYSKFRRERLYANEPRSYIYHKKELGIAIEVIENEIKRIYLFPTKKDYSLLCEDKQTRTYYSSKKWFTDSKLKARYIHYNSFPKITNLTLSATEISATCSLLDLTKNKICSDSVKEITVITTATDLENDPLVYDYKVTGGKIIGHGSTVIWDLSGVKAGTYTITARVDDGCGFCGETMTGTIIVKE